jgi:EmrB/QacA subfamily drug resistance transporter
MTRQQRLVLVVSILASFVAFLDGAIVNVALPAIQRDLGGGFMAQQWIVDAYLLTLGSLILIAGSLSDLFGRKRILSLGLLGFGAASILCAIAPNSTALIIARGFQGVAGALLVPSSLALIMSVFSGKEQGKAVGSWTAWTGIAFIFGPLLGGLIVDNSSWRWIFAINVIPIALTLYLLSRIDMIKDARTKSKVDIAGAILCALGLGGLVYALIEQPIHGWGDPMIFAPLAAGILLLAGFLWYEKHTEQPMLPAGLFKNHNFAIGNIATLAIYAGLTASTFLLIVFLQQVGGYSALKAGFSLLPVTLILFFFSSRIGALSGRFGPRLFMGFGPIIAGVGFLMIMRVNADINYWSQLLPGIIVFGIGLVITVAPLVSAILGDVPKEQSGIASAVNNAVARIAGLLAVAAVGAIVAAQFSSAIDKYNNLGFFTPQDVSIIKEHPLQSGPPITDSYKIQNKDGKINGKLGKGYIIQANDGDYGQAIINKASVKAFRAGTLAISILMISGGVISLIGIRNPAREETSVQ